MLLAVRLFSLMFFGITSTVLVDELFVLSPVLD